MLQKRSTQQFLWQKQVLKYLSLPNYIFNVYGSCVDDPLRRVLNLLHTNKMLILDER